MVPIYGGWVFGATLVALNYHHGERWGMYHLPLVFLLLWPAYLALAQDRVPLSWAWTGAAVGALLACGIGVYQIFVLGHDRAGSHVNPIPFGNLSLLLSVASLLGLRHLSVGRWEVAHRVLLLCGGLGGITASLLSGTKGAWLSLMVVLFVAQKLVLSQMSRVKRWFAYVAATLVLLVVFIHPESMVHLRAVSAYQGVIHWWATGESSEGSVGPRLEMWKFGIDIGLERPWLGYGKDGMMNSKQLAVDSWGYANHLIHWHTLHNEFLNIWIIKGAIGVLALILLYWGLAFSCKRRLKSPDQEVRTFALMGLCLVMMYIEFGLSEVAIQFTWYRGIYIFWMVMIVAAFMRNPDISGNSSVEK